MRELLKQTAKTFPNQKGIVNPTARWVFQLFTGVHVLLL
jgi:hypothetical protein